MRAGELSSLVPEKEEVVDPSAEKGQNGRLILGQICMEGKPSVIKLKSGERCLSRTDYCVCESVPLHFKNVELERFRMIVPLWGACPGPGNHPQAVDKHVTELNLGEVAEDSHSFCKNIFKEGEPYAVACPMGQVCGTTLNGPVCQEFATAPSNPGEEEVKVKEGVFVAMKLASDGKLRAFFCPFGHTVVASPGSAFCRGSSKALVLNKSNRCLNKGKGGCVFVLPNKKELKCGMGEVADGGDGQFKCARDTKKWWCGGLNACGCTGQEAEDPGEEGAFCVVEEDQRRYEPKMAAIKSGGPLKLVENEEIGYILRWHFSLWKFQDSWKYKSVARALVRESGRGVSAQLKI